MGDTLEVTWKGPCKMRDVSGLRDSHHPESVQPPRHNIHRFLSLARLTAGYLLQMPVHNKQSLLGCPISIHPRGGRGMPNGQPPGLQGRKCMT